MIFERFEAPGLSQYSYIVGDAGTIAVIDPKRDIDTYLQFADRKGLRIAYVLETHIHADFASGARELAAASGAELCLSAYDKGETYSYGFDHRALKDGDELPLDAYRLRVLHTPGHTPEHISLLLLEPGRSAEPLAMFSGDFLFIGSVGRPDLLGDDEKLKLAGALHDSIGLLKNLPDGMLLYPGHGAGSLCGAGMAQRQESTLGYERQTNPFLQIEDQDAFVKQVLGSVPEFPDYYRRMKQVNSAGPEILNGIPGSRHLPLREFQAVAKEKDAVLVDLRRQEAFGGAHIPGSLNVGLAPNLSSWAAWVLPYDRPILLIGDAQTNLEEARRALIRVGLDSIIGSLRGGIGAWLESGSKQAHIPQISVQELREVLNSPQSAVVLDVRSPGEWNSGHVEGAMHIPGGELPKRLNDLPAEKPVYIICGSGYRSSIASSILERAGRRHVTNVNGGMTAWNNQKYPVAKG
jgi:hydroxyacylglutathione hydrolase